MRFARRVKSIVTMLGAMLVGGVIGHFTTLGLFAVAASVGVGVWLSHSRGIGRQLDAGEFDAYQQKLLATSTKGNPFRAELALLEHCYLVMRLGLLRETIELSRSLAETAKYPDHARFAEVYGATCASLLGEAEDISIPSANDRGLQGLAPYYCILAARRGDIERALSIREPTTLVADLLYGRARFKHGHRLLALVQAALRGDGDALSAAQRAAMVAGYPGEFDYVADHWPAVAALIAKLDLYATQPVGMRARPRR